MGGGSGAPVAAGLAAGIVFVLLFALAMPASNYSEFSQKFASHKGEMILSLDMDSMGNDDQLNRVTDVLNNCERQRVHVFYATGSMEVAVDGMDDGLCPMTIKIEKEEGQERLVCSVPLAAMNGWFGWMNRAAPLADEIPGTV